MRLAISKNGKNLDKIVSAKTPEKYKDGILLFKALSEGLLANKKPTSVVGGIASPIKKPGRIIDFQKTNWTGKPFLADLKKIFGKDVILENDSGLAAIGEAIYGAGKGKKVVAYLTVSTGIGGARIVDGKIDTNATGYEPRLQLLEGHPLKNFGSLSSGSAIRETYRQAGENLKDKKAWKEIELWLTMGINNIIVLWSPQILVVGGPVAANKNISFERITKNLKKNLKILPKPPKITKARLTQKSGLYGALALAKQNNK